VLLKGQPTAHHDLFAPLFIQNYHHIVIQYFGNFHSMTQKQKNLTSGRCQKIRFCLPQQLQSNTRTVTTSAARST